MHFRTPPLFCFGAGGTKRPSTPPPSPERMPGVIASDAFVFEHRVAVFVTRQAALSHHRFASLYVHGAFPLGHVISSRGREELSFARAQSKS